VTERPLYKDHPLWNEAIALTREAYAVASTLPPERGELSHALRRAAVAVPARVAEALSKRGEPRRESTLAARSSLAEMTRHLAAAGGADAGGIAEKAQRLDRSIRFELEAREEAFT